MAQRVEDYALIGDCITTALVGRDGSIDWLCLPRFDSPACFAALLGGPENGHWRIAPEAPLRRTERRYRDDTLILETLFETDDGAVELIDFMRPRDGRFDLVRLVRGRRGRVRMRTRFVLRFEYGSVVPWVERLAEGGLSAVAGPERVVLRTRVPLRGRDHETEGDFTVDEGETVAFALTWCDSIRPPPPPLDTERALAETERFWHRWSRRCAPAGEWSGAVKRSLMVLKALIHAPTGGMVAAPTTSLPEQLGGSRNWDYRFCWLRDATFTLLALMNAGYHDEARSWRDWLFRAVAGSPEQLQVLYGVGGERRLTEWEVPWLAGYEGARPVRVGNDAAGQNQLDIYGELLDALHHANRQGLPPAERAEAITEALLDNLAEIWREPDCSIWEVRGPPQHFTYSKVMAWAAFDRAVKIFAERGIEAPLASWRRIRDEIHADVCRNAFDREVGSFVQAYGAKTHDAALLLMPLVGFLPPDDPRMVGTVKAIEENLVVDGLVLRYNTKTGSDGLPPGEGAFLACSFWLADNLILQGRLDEGRALFERLLGLANDVGLLAEEYDTRAKRQIGNFPQAFSHVALVNTAFNLTRTEGPAHQRSTRRVLEGRSRQGFAGRGDRRAHRPHAAGVEPDLRDAPESARPRGASQAKR